MRSPITDSEIDHLLARSTVAEVAKSILRAGLTEPPPRSAQSGPQNVASRIPNAKTGRTDDVESRTLEGALFHRLNNDPDVLCFVMQPAPPVKIVCEHCGKPWDSIADAMTLELDRGAWIETRTQNRIERILAKHPGFYVPTDTPGHYRCPSGEIYAKANGLDYLILTPAAFSAVETRNLRDLAAASGAALPDQEIINAIVGRIARDPAVTKFRLVHEGFDAAAIDILVAQGLLYVDLLHEVVSDPANLHLYLDATVALAHKSPPAVAVGNGAPRPVVLDVGGRLLLGDRVFEVLAPGVAVVVLRDPGSGALRDVRREDLERLVRDGVVRAAPVAEGATTDAGAAKKARIYGEANDAALTLAAKRAAILARNPPGRRDAGPDAAAPSKRTLRRWRKQQREVLGLTGDPWAGLIPKPASGGGRQLRTSVQTVLKDTIRRHLITPNPLSAADIRRLVAATLTEMKLEVLVPSERTVRKWMHKVSRHEQALAQLGRRGANNFAPWRELDPDEAPANSDRCWGAVHLDATKLDIETRCPTTGKKLGRPWITVGVDGFSGLPLFWFIHYEAPSAATTLQALRVCVQRHGRLPESLVIDQGPEFHSAEFQRFLAWAAVTAVYRPTAQPRFGAPVERLMLELSRIVKRLSGQTSARRRGRSMGSEVEPSVLARWDLRSLERLLEDALAILENTERIRTGESPRERFDRGLLEQGAVARRLFSLNDPAFVAYTLPLVDDDKRKLNALRGINVYYLTYWNDALAHPELDGIEVEVRYDPWDASRVWAHVDDIWVECLARELRHVRTVSAAEWQALTKILRERLRHTAQRRRLTGTAIAALIKEGIETEALLEIRLRDAARTAEAIQDVAARAKAAGSTPDQVAKLVRVLSTPPPADQSVGDPQPIGDGPDLLAEGEDDDDPRFFHEVAA